MVTVPKSRNSNQTLEGSRGTSRGLVDTSFAFVTVDTYIHLGAGKHPSPIDQLIVLKIPYK